MRIALSLAALALSGHALAAGNIEDYTQVTGTLHSESGDWWKEGGVGLSAHGVKALDEQFGITGSVQSSMSRPCSNAFSDCHGSRAYRHDATLGLVWRRAEVGHLAAKAGRGRLQNEYDGSRPEDLFYSGFKHRTSIAHFSLGGEYYLGGQGVLGAEVERARFETKGVSGRYDTTTTKLYGEYWQADTTLRAAISKTKDVSRYDNELGAAWYGIERLALGATLKNVDKDYRRAGLDLRYQLPFAKDALTLGTKLEFGREDQRRVEFNLRYDFGPGAKMTLKDRDRNLRY